MSDRRSLPGWCMAPLSALIEVVVPRSDSFHPDLTDYIKNHIDTFVGYFPIHMKLLFPMGLLLLELAVPVFMRKWKRFSKLDFAEREIYIKNWMNSKIQLRRELIRGVKGVVMLAYYSHPAVMEHIGYDLQGHIGECVAREFK